MKVVPLGIPDVLRIEVPAREDERGSFMEAWNKKAFDEVIGHRIEFVQDNQSSSIAGVIRGLHFQIDPKAQGKLVRVVSGTVFDVAVDLRRTSRSFGRWTSAILSAENRHQVWIPTGFAHGFLVISDRADVVYKVTNFYSPEHERTLRWDDADVGIEWPLTGSPILSPKDAAGPQLRDLETTF